MVSDFEHGGLDSFKNLKIASATAEVPGDRFADLVARGVGVLIQQSLRGHKNCRGAIAALRRAEIGKGILQGMEVSVFSEAFHCQNLFSTAFECQNKTGEHGLTL
jgi:hypothetical protein